ncbi:unnamed protein product [Schistosoma mattheei]|uniref:Uncharacterized protein n=1 Tax=Schistosoma mattheei TaxID=31246 RepID=A0AA85B0F4_9TREM|nr:unnamed protein product [Schistosoma mattheei]
MTISSLVLSFFKAFCSCVISWVLSFFYRVSSTMVCLIYCWFISLILAVLTDDSSAAKNLRCHLYCSLAFFGVRVPLCQRFLLQADHSVVCAFSMSGYEILICFFFFEGFSSLFPVLSDNSIAVVKITKYSDVNIPSTLFRSSMSVGISESCSMHQLSLGVPFLFHFFHLFSIPLGSWLEVCILHLLTEHADGNTRGVNRVVRQWKPVFCQTSPISKQCKACYVHMILR